jgi:toxin YoeB
LDVHFSDDGWDDYLHRSRSDPDLHRRLNEIIENLRRTPFSGLGKPEALKGDLSGWWSRRITGAHRLVYRIQGRKGEDQRVEIIQCRYHY